MTFSRIFSASTSLTLVTALLVSSCSVGPDFKHPAPPAVKSYVSSALPARTASAPTLDGEAQSFDGDSDIPAQWWKMYQSPGLNQLMDEALKSNPDLAAAEASLRQAKESAAAELGEFFPSVNANFDPEREKIPLAAYGLPGAGSSLFTLYQANVSVSYGLDVFGGTRRAYESAKAQEEYQRFEREATYLTLTTNVVTAAVREASLREQIKATQDIIDYERKQRDLLNNQFRLGGASKANLLEQEATLAQVEATLPPLQKQLEQTRDQLAALTGHLPSDPLPVTFALSSLHLPTDLPITLPSRLVEQRPDIRAAEAQLHSANAEIGVATANMLPQISITGNYGYDAITTSTLFTPQTEAWNLTGSILQPLFHGGTLLHERREAIAARDKAREQYRSTVLSAFQNVADSLRALQYDAETLNAQFLAEQAAKSSLTLTEDQFKDGAISYSLLLDAERTYSQAHVSLVQAQAARIGDTAALFQSLGGGWWNRGKDIHTAQIMIDKKPIIEKSAPAPVTPTATPHATTATPSLNAQPSTNNEKKP
jgi:NodT family efflux transporter outer membrane factor (OMF) lipoprotein